MKIYCNSILSHENTSAIGPFGTDSVHAGSRRQSDHTTNCNFLTELVDRVKHHGKSVGIYASKYMWQGIMGSFTACPALGSEDLWYAHYDNNPSFSDFSSFGGWKTTHVKQFQGTSTLCGAGVDKNYKP